MVKRKISITFVADADISFMIETMIRSDAAKIIQDNGASQLKMEMENLPVKNRGFNFVSTI